MGERKSARSGWSGEHNVGTDLKGVRGRAMELSGQQLSQQREQPGPKVNVYLVCAR